jgi:hypothetical protein
MTATTTSDRPISRRWEAPPIAGVVAFALATGLGAIAVFGPQRQEDQVDAFPALVVVYAIVTALVFALVVRPAAANGSSSRRVVVLGSLAVLSIAVFWSGLPAVLGMATLAVRPHAPASRGRAIGVGLAVLALTANVPLVFVG